jgi:hypothetical protein
MHVRRIEAALRGSEKKKARAQRRPEATDSDGEKDFCKTCVTACDDSHSSQPHLAVMASTARKEVTDVSWFSREVGNNPHGALSRYLIDDKGFRERTFPAADHAKTRSGSDRSGSSHFRSPAGAFSCAAGRQPPGFSVRPPQDCRGLSHDARFLICEFFKYLKMLEIFAFATVSTATLTVLAPRRGLA